MFLRSHEKSDIVGIAHRDEHPQNDLEIWLTHERRFTDRDAGLTPKVRSRGGIKE